MDSMFNRFFGNGAEAQAMNAWSPKVDVEETDKEMLVKADLPGVDPKNVEVSLSHDVLTLRGERKDEKEEKGKQFHRMERFVGTFFREIPLPAGADADRITAEANKGVVTIRIPKKPGDVTKKIAVQAKE
jgi:HSP20 family protein